MGYTHNYYRYIDRGEKERLLEGIEKLRESLHFLIEQSNDINDKEVLIKSQKLDELLTQYEKLKNK